MRLRALRIPRRQAFTLIELLVVIAIISMLISILTPSLARARQQAKSTVCMATLNEMMKGIVAYGNDYNFALRRRLGISRGIRTSPGARRSGTAGRRRCISRCTTTTITRLMRTIP